MKKILFLMTILPMVLFTACSSDDEEELSQEEKAIQTQTEVYNNVLSNIVGHWKGSQHYNTSVYRPVGWEDISHISWTQEYIFNSDGTCKDIVSSNLIYEGTYSIIKNKDYIKYPSSQCELFLIITHANGIVNEHAIWMDGEYLRIGSSLSGIKPSASSGGEASIRYRQVTN